MPRIKITNVTKRFPRHKGRVWFAGYVRDAVKNGRNRESGFVAIENLSLEIKDGESVAIIGRNGAGKSTLLNMVSGLMEPDEGSIEVEGRVATLLDLGAGFHPDLTGVENARTLAALSGLTRQQFHSHLDEIIEFSGLGDFLGEPVRTYSSGMMLRLAFSIATTLDPEILIIDEVLAVGDQAFQQKSLKRIQKLREKGRIFVCVSHALTSLATLCSHAVWLERGKLVKVGRFDQVSEEYNSKANYSIEV